MLFTWNSVYTESVSYTHLDVYKRQLLARDFREILTVTPRLMLAEELNICLKSSNLWSDVITMNLYTHTRVHLLDDVLEGVFSSKFIQIWEGKISANSDGRLQHFPNICQLIQNVDKLVSCIFPNISENHSSDDWLCSTAILAPNICALLRCV